MNIRRFLKNSVTAAVLFVTALFDHSAPAQEEQPIIDVHLHAYLPKEAKFVDFPATYVQVPNPVTGQVPKSKTAGEHMRATLAMMDKHNIVLGYVSGPLEAVEMWHKFAPNRFVGGAYLDRAGIVSLSELRSRFKDGRLGLMGEIGAQYEGYSPSDPQFHPYVELAEAFGIPVGIHTGTSAPKKAFGDPANGARPRFRVRYGNPLLLEDMLVRHPNLRVFAMHMGDPWLTETLEMLRMYPDLYLDISVKNWVSPRPVFHRYLKELVDAGFGRRIMFGSDQGLWPESIEIAIQAIETAEFLTKDQKRDIFFNNAVRFFRLEDKLGMASGRNGPVYKAP